MTDPTQSDACSYLHVPTAALPTADFNLFLADVKEMLGTSETDRLTIFYGLLWWVARNHSWSYLTRMGDKSFSAPDPKVYERMYVDRCNQRKVAAVLLGRVYMRKVNTALDDYPDNFNQ